MGVSEVDNLELKKRARRRLVGAAALALLAAIVLPMVMDEEPGSLQNHDIQVVIPDRDAAASLAVPVDGHPVEPPEEPALPAPPVEREEVIAIAPPATVAPAPAPPARPAARPDSRPTAVAPTPPAAASAPTNRNSGNEEARVRAILEGEALASAASTQRYIVQVGAFGDRDKAIALSNNLGAQGFRAYAEQAGAVTRVRVGPFANRQEAETTIAKLKSLGMDGVITSR